MNRGVVQDDDQRLVPLFEQLTQKAENNSSVALFQSLAIKRVPVLSNAPTMLSCLPLSAVTFAAGEFSFETDNGICDK